LLTTSQTASFNGRRDDPALKRRRPESHVSASTPVSLRTWVEAPEQVHADEPVSITLRLQNTSIEPVDIYLTGRPTAFDFVVTRLDGAVLWRRLEGKVIPMLLQIRRLAPGEVIEFQETWNQRTNRGEPVGPGRYLVRGILPTDEPEPLKTPPVTLHVLP
jgi:hypothetical protein